MREYKYKYLYWNWDGTSEVGNVEIEARGAEGAVVGVSIGRFEVAGAVEDGGVPEAAAEIGKERKVGPKLGDFWDEDGVMVDGS